MSIRKHVLLTAALCCAIAVCPANPASAETVGADPAEPPRPQVTVLEWGLDRPVPAVPRTVVPAPVPPLDPYAGITLAQLLTGVEGHQQRFEPSQEQLENARHIVEIVKQRRMPPYAAVVALATALQESTLRNLTVAVDYDSLGLFQQRPSAGWGRPEQLTDPAYATNTFLDVLERKVPEYQAVPLWQAAQATQRSAFPTAYARWHEQAAHLTVRLLAEE